MLSQYRPFKTDGEISQLQYRQGSTDLLTVLQARQTLFSAEGQLAQTKLAHMQPVLHLFEALIPLIIDHLEVPLPCAKETPVLGDGT
jgi:outer membrane protein TolC